LAEAISRDLNLQMLAVLGPKNLLSMPFDNFIRTVNSCKVVFETWSEHIKEFMSVCREVSRKRSEKFLPIKVNAAHLTLEQRISFILNFRKQHEQLVRTIEKVAKNENKFELEQDQDLGLTDIGASQQIDSAMDYFKNVSILNLSAGIPYIDV
jgi:dynein heavy chain 1